MLNPETGEKLSKRDRDRRIREKANAWLRNQKKTAADLATASGMNEGRLTEWLPPKVNNDNNPLQLSLSEAKAVMQVVGLRDEDLPEIMIHDFQRNGYAPELLLNFLALQGWSPGGDREQMTMDEMVQLFGLDRINPASPKFNRDKLTAFSTDFFAKAPPDRLIAAMRDYLSVNAESPLTRATDEQLAKILHMNAGFHVLREVDEKSRFFFTPDDKIVYAPDAVEKVLMKNERQGLNALTAVRPILAGVGEWVAANLEAAVKGYCGQSGLSLGKVAQPIRVAVSGTTVSPPIFESLEFLGREHTLARIDRCLKTSGS
jgi:glutamyl-tRNA synthetase